MFGKIKIVGIHTITSLVKIIARGVLESAFVISLPRNNFGLKDCICHCKLRAFQGALGVLGWCLLSVWPTLSSLCSFNNGHFGLSIKAFCH